MKKYARGIITALIAFVAVGFFYPGFSYNHDYLVLFTAAIIFAILSIFIKPVLKILSLPFNLITFGFFSFLINIIILYGVGYFIHSFKIIAFHFAGYSVSGFNFPAYDLSQLVSALVASILIGILASGLHWLFR